MRGAMVGNDGTALENASMRAYLALFVAVVVLLPLNLAVVVGGLLDGSVIEVVPLVIVIGLAAILPRLWGIVRRTRAADRADRVACSTAAPRREVRLEGAFDAAAPVRAPRLFLRVLGADGEVLGFVRSGLLSPGANPPAHSVMVGDPSAGGVVAFELADGSRRLLPGSPLSSKGPDVPAAWNATATALLGWTAPADPQLLHEAARFQAFRGRLRRACLVLWVALLVALFAPFGVLVMPVALVGSLALVAVAIRHLARSRRVLGPRIVELDPNAVRFVPALAEILVRLAAPEAA